MLETEKMSDLLGCDDMSCLSELGGAIGVDRIIGGSVSKLSGALVVSLQLVDIQTAKVAERITLNWGGPESALPEVLATAAELLVIPKPQQKPGDLHLAGISASASVHVDGELRGSGPVYLKGLTPGIHKLRIEASGFDSYQAPFLIRPGQTAQLDIKLVKETATPFYASWWFWTLTALAVGGGTAAAVIYSEDTGTIRVMAPEL